MAASVERIVAGILEMPESEVDEQTGPATEGRWTSLRHLEIVSSLQREYAVRLTPRQIRSVRTVGDLRRLLAADGEGR